MDKIIFAKEMKSWKLILNYIRIVLRDGYELMGVIYEHRKDSDDEKAECFLCEDLTSDFCKMSSGKWNIIAASFKLEV